jgi:phospholipid transport system substrate-binding protein
MTRRRLIAGSAAMCIGAAGTGAITPAVASGDAVADFMNEIRGPLLRAATSATRSSFRRVIRNYADVAGIALYSLGTYRDGLARSSQTNYYNGVTRYMAYYFSTMATEYRVENAGVVGESWQEGDSYYIDTKIYLENGRTYNARWELIKSGNSYKIKNVRVLGFWLAWFQRQQFQEFISSRGGSVNALVTALSP